ncbi:hypothetical protein [Ornithinimicrobium flavum]|uniref:hypothetical protein n=1 Tax=Ornithinimicrobium flavum TaxID=1288636 RepID=UPI00106F0B43|nr:hypothetical protein [Ornithinimicrobium flavum]
MTQRLRLVGIMLMVFGLVFLGGAAVAFSMYQDGRHSLQSFSEVQGVELSYNDQGQLVDRGDPAAAEAIMTMLTDEWGYPVSDREMDPADPLVNTASEYMYQMAVITHHVIYGTYPVTLTEDQLVDADGNALTEVVVNGETIAIPATIPAEGLTFDVNGEGRYWNDFDRTNPVDAAARPLIWTGTVHGLVGELGVGTVTASALKLALGLTALIAGLGVINLLTGAGLYWAAGPRRTAELPPAPVEQPELERIG